MDYSENFLTLEQIEKLIELSVSDIHEMLSGHIYFKGLVHGHESKIIYLDGYYLIEDTEMAYDIYNREDLEYYENLVPAVNEILVSIKGCEFSNNEKFLDVIFSLKSSQEIDVVLYSYKQLCEIMKKLGCPAPKCTTELSKKEYAYDVKLVDQKSNFTLHEACQIAANMPVNFIRKPSLASSQIQISPSVRHFLEILSECVKGQNQDNFHLITKELWVYSNPETHQGCVKYDNGARIVISAYLDSHLTVISKSEFLRWCKYMDIDTGLSFNQKLIDESVEALRLKNEKLEKQIDEQNMEIIDLKWIGSPKENLDIAYPPELQLSIDAFEQLCLDQLPLPTNEKIKEWLTKESKERGISHNDGGKQHNGLSDVKLKTIPSIIKSQ